MYCGCIQGYISLCTCRNKGKDGGREAKGKEIATDEGV